MTDLCTNSACPLKWQCKRYKLNLDYAGKPEYADMKKTRYENRKNQCDNFLKN